MQVLEQILQEIEEAKKERLFRLCDYTYRDRQNLIINRIMEIIHSHMNDEPVSNSDKQDSAWIPAENLPERKMRVQALIKHHKWITDYDSYWVPEEEKTVHPEWMEICEAIYKNGKFTFRSMEDDEFMETAYISPKENIAEPASEILMWRPVICSTDNWIQAEYPPKTGTYILLSFSNLSCPLIGRYEASEDGGAFYLGDCDGEDTCISNDLYVNAWQPLPKRYRRMDFK